MIPAALCIALIQDRQAPRELARRVVTAHDWASRIGREMGDSIWPGYRPDTIPVLYLLRGHGTLLLGWGGALPPGFTPDSAVAGATAAELLGRGAAQVVVDTQSIASLVGLTAHEAFHVFERASRTEGRRFGRGENSFLVTSYPVFDPQNEAGMALEGRILASAERASTKTEKQMLAREFLAVRESRQRALGAELAEFEQLAELNEGLAEYALVRAVQLAARLPDFPDRAGAEHLQSRKRVGLRQLTADVTLSIRLRYYATGPALGALLDALEGPAWKSRLVDQNLTVQDALAGASQDALAGASGYRATELALRRQAETRFVMASLRRGADSGVAGLRALRRKQVDSILAAPGVLLIVAIEGRSLGLCGIDPQNLLQVEPGVLLHTRWVVACVGDAFQATFNTPVVQDRNAETLRAVVGADSTVKVTANGADVRVESPLVSLRASKAEVSRDRRVLMVKIKP